jgi:flagellar biosynthesis GTPase FlhF
MQLMSLVYLSFFMKCAHGASWNNSWGYDTDYQKLATLVANAWVDYMDGKTDVSYKGLFNTKGGYDQSMDDQKETARIQQEVEEKRRKDEEIALILELRQEEERQALEEQRRQEEMRQKEREYDQLIAQDREQRIREEQYERNRRNIEEDEERKQLDEEWEQYRKNKMQEDVERENNYRDMFERFSDCTLGQQPKIETRWES